MTTTPFVISLCACALLSACVEEPSDLENLDEPVPDETVFYESVVDVRADGTIHVRDARAITAGEQRAQNELRSAIERGEISPPQSVVTVDGACNNESLWLYDRTDLTGNRICFWISPTVYGPGNRVELKNFVRIQTTLGPSGPIFIYGNWEIPRGSYYPGRSDGFLDRWFETYNANDIPFRYVALWNDWGPPGSFTGPVVAENLVLYND